MKAPKAFDALELPSWPAPVPVPVPDRTVTGPADIGPLPVVMVDSLPAANGEPAELLVMAANPHRDRLSDLCIGVALPPGVRVTSVTPPAGAEVLTERVDSRQVVRCRLRELEPNACVGLDVSVSLPRRRPTHVVTAFVTLDENPGFSLTCRHEVQVDSPPTGPLRLIHSD
ncbi:MAG TPA: hypothetical protein VFP72_23840 [Kineosporiaceae bacterium]|nr:hypothetical protein [Kineosporiaceae bacterium]